MSSRKELLDFYGHGAEYFHYDFADDKCYIEEVWDCEPVMEAAKRLSDATPGKEFRHAAFIPPHVMNEAFRDGWFNDPKAWKRWANNSDNKMFRTWPGKL